MSRPSRRGSTTPSARRGRALTLLLAVSWGPVVAEAQPTVAAASPARSGAASRDSAGARSHTVRRGETLWGLAGELLGSPYRWPALHGANADLVADPHWIYPGQALRVPGVGDALPLAPAAPGAADTAEGGERGEGRDGAESVPARLEAFSAPAAVAAPSAASAPRAAAADSARGSEWLAAPYVAGRDAFRGAGALVDGVDIPPYGIRTSRARLQLLDHVALRLPAGASTDSGAAFVVAGRGPSIRGADVVVPLAVAVLDGGGTRALRTARLVRVFGLVEAGQAVLPLAADAPAAASAVAGPTEVLWVPGRALLPTLQSYVVLARGGRDGVRAGDRYELVGDGRRDAGGAALPAVRVAIVRVVRVGPDAATAVVTHHDQPAVGAGLEARPLPR